jgi:serine/threonine-protein kinase
MIPTALAAVVAKLMAREKDSRFASASDVAEALRAIDPAKRATHPPPPRTDPPPRAPPAIAARFTTVAVLPFANRGAADDAYLGEALAEEIIDALSMSRGLRVFARGAVMPYAGTTRDARDVGHELGADAVVYGTFQRSGDDVRASARLVSVADGLQLWAAREDRPLGDLLAGGAALARGIATSLAVEAKPRHVGTRDPAAVELYLRGRRSYYGAEEGGRLQARAFFEKAFALAPHDPAILAGLALTNALASRTPEDLATTVRFAEEAVSAAPESAEARYALATVRLHENRLGEAATEMRTALELAPSNAEAHLGIGTLLGEIRRFDEALQHLTFARFVDPTMKAALYDAARIHALRDGVDRGIEMLEDVQRSERKAIWWLFRLRLAAWRSFGEVEELVNVVRSTSSIDSGVVRAIVESFEGNGWPLDEHGSPRRRAFARQIMAELAGARGNTAEAVEHVIESERAGVFDLAWLELCPALAGVREDPRYATVHASVARRADEIASVLVP